MPAFLVSWTEHHQVTAVIVAPTPELARRQVETESIPNWPVARSRRNPSRPTAG
jgi:hypothetical protein